MPIHNGHWPLLVKVANSLPGNETRLEIIKSRNNKGDNATSGQVIFWQGSYYLFGNTDSSGYTDRYTFDLVLSFVYSLGPPISS